MSMDWRQWGADWHGDDDPGPPMLAPAEKRLWTAVLARFLSDLNVLEHVQCRQPGCGCRGKRKEYLLCEACRRCERIQTSARAHLMSPEGQEAIHDICLIAGLDGHTIIATAFRQLRLKKNRLTRYSPFAYCA